MNPPTKQAGAVLTRDRATSDGIDKIGRASGKPANVANGGFLSERPERRGFESVFARLVATAGIVGVGTALGAILVAADVAGWIIGFAVSIVTVALAAMLWRSRRL